MSLGSQVKDSENRALAETVIGRNGQVLSLPRGTQNRHGR